MESSGGNLVAPVYGTSEDSIDIYDGLNLNHLSSSASPLQLKESMDLYEEIVTEEQQGRESSYTELKFCFQAAQNQIKDLHRRLELMEIQNKGLNTENFHLKKNISALLRTAKQEVMRKDAEIQRLNQSSGKGRFPLYRVNLHEQNSNSQALTFSMNSIPKSPAPSNPPLSAQSTLSRNIHLSKIYQSQRRERDSPNNKASASCIEPEVLSCNHSKVSSSEHYLVTEKWNEHSFSNPTITSSNKHHVSDKHKTREDKCQTHFVTIDNKYSNSSSKTYTQKIDKQNSHKLDTDTRGRHNLRTHQIKEGKTVNEHCPPINNSQVIYFSDSCQGSSRERRYKKTHHSAHHISTEEYRQFHKKIKISDGHGRSCLEHLISKDQMRYSTSQRAKSFTDFSKEKQWDRLPKDYQWKGNRTHEENNSSRHRGESERITLGESQPPKKSCRAKHIVKNEKQQKRLKTSVKEPVKKSYQNRKLCFMEKLNLTLSPIKNPVSNNTRQGGSTVMNPQIEKADINLSDEIDGNGLQNNLKEAPTEYDEAPMFKKLQGTDVQEKVTSYCKAEGNSGQSIDLAANCMDIEHTPGSKDNSSQLEIHRNDDAKTKFIQNVQLDSNEQADLTAYRCHKFGKVDTKQPSIPLQQLDNENYKYKCIAFAQSVALVRNSPKGLTLGTNLPDKLKKSADRQKNEFLNQEIDTSPQSQQPYHITLSYDSQPGVNPSFSTTTIAQNACSAQDDSKDTNTVSSTIGVELVGQQEHRLPETIPVLINKEDIGSSGTVNSPCSSVDYIGVSNVSSTTEEIVLPKNPCAPTDTLREIPGEDSHAKKIVPCSSKPLLHDEDSMMHTFCHIKRIPDAISPLRSPVHLMNTSHHLVDGKLGHIKSLQKEFSAISDDGNKNLHLNKENKYPGCPLKNENQDLEDKQSGLPSNISDTEQEEEDILTGTEDAKSPNATKCLKVAEKLRHTENLLKNKSKVTCLSSEEKTTTGNVSTQSPGNNSRFKTVCPTSSKASFSTIEEVMEMFTSVRLEIRRKYMKLHKTFPRKSFCGVMENFRESFLEFLDGAHFGQICCQAMDLKSKLKVLIVSVFDKVADNGIVKRIFEQQAVDLKQKLWVFVDNQVDFLLKDIYMTLKSFCSPAQTLPEEKMHETEKLFRHPYKRTQSLKDLKAPLITLNQLKPLGAPYKTGLGSRGKDIRIDPTENEKKKKHTQNDIDNDSRVDHSPREPSISGKHKMTAFVASQSTSVFEKSDFELLTEQQATSLTFNLVRDSQMGEIFKCLLQGADLLETNEKRGESTLWALETPKKNAERVLSMTTTNKFYSSQFLSPTKLNSPKHVGTKSSISLQKMTPQAQAHLKPNLALFDESCLLEIPSENQVTLQSSILSQCNPCILSEDLAVSLTIPSPLKSESHLSFLQPSGIHPISTPDSVISAHIGEDALLDGEDATEENIHLALDTDNSSLGSSNSRPSETVVNNFVLKPELPMHALVMEKSNKHFILKIRQGITLSKEESSYEAVSEDNQIEKYVAVQKSQEKHLLDKMHKYSSPSKVISSEYSVSEHSKCPLICQNASIDIRSTKDLRIKKNPVRSEPLSLNSEVWERDDLHNVMDSSKITHSNETFLKSRHHSSGHTIKAPSLDDENPKPPFNMSNDSPNPLCQTRAISSDSQTRSSSCKLSVQRKSQCQRTKWKSQNVPNLSHLEGELERPAGYKTVKKLTEKDKPCEKSQKRKYHHEQSKNKRTRRDQDYCIEDIAISSKNDVEPQSLSSSPNSLSAMNVIKKKGALVMAWTRDEDRAILVQLKRKGASRKTFASLSDMLKKTPEQISQRFYQLMNLLKKQGSMNT
ncbi:CASP8-associated protein 2 isoform X2 [Stigmatopora argus]